VASATWSSIPGIVDNDPLVLVHARALLDTILRGAAKILDFAQPVALMMLGILGNVEDYDEARTIVDRLVTAYPRAATS